MINKDMLKAYVCNFGGVEKFGLGVDGMLANWNKAKSIRLHQLFSGQLILEKEVKFEKEPCQIIHELEDMHFSFINHFYNFISNIDWMDYDIIWNVRRLVDYEALATNRVKTGFTLVHPVTGKKLRVDKGQKLMGTIKKTMAFIDYKEFEKNSFEQFRLEHSRILNDKLVKGTMCLSIHPFDYMTLSDNNHGWESCMSWMNEGCYRAGTLEVMNCDNTIVAYLKSSNEDFTFSCGEKYAWSSKKWRQLFHATDNIIMSNKPYPFFHDAMSKFCLDWIKELSEKNLGKKYNEKMFDWDNMDGTEVENITLYANTLYMYNDLENDSESKFYVEEGKENECCQFRIGGRAYCLECGCEIDRENGLTCYSCSDEFYCDCCDENCSGDSIEVVNGDRVCHYCYENYYHSCENCGTVYHTNSGDINYYNDEVFEGQCCKWCREQLVTEYEDRKEVAKLLAIKPVE